MITTQTTTIKDTKTWSDLTTEIETLEHEQAPGSETFLWGLYVFHCVEQMGGPPWSEDVDFDLPCPADNYEWWIKAYELQERLEALPAEVAKSIFDGDWSVSLADLEKDIDAVELREIAARTK